MNKYNKATIQTHRIVMEYYKDINELPFIDFTLNEFSKWSAVLKNAKQNYFTDLTCEEIIQIVYYQTAIVNYDTAVYFLNKCKHPLLDSQVQFLKMLIHWESDNDYCSTKSLEYYEKLINLCLICYKPAISYLIKRYENPGNNNSKFGSSIAHSDAVKLNLLIKIETNMTESNMDVFELGRMRGYIDELQNMLNGITTRPYFSLRFMSQKVLCDVLGGSEKAMCRLLHADFIISTYRLMIPDEEIDNILKVIKEFDLQHSVERIFKSMLLKPDFDNSTIVFLLRSYTFHFNILPVTHKKILNLCIDYCYDHLLRSHNNVGIIISYLNLLKGQIIDTKKYNMISLQSLLLLFYSEGPFFFHYTKHCSGLGGISHKSPLDEGQEGILTDSTPFLIELTENHFWCVHWKEMTITSILTKKMRMASSFYNMLTMEPNLWKAALAIFGLNLVNYPLKKSWNNIHIFLKDFYQTMKNDTIPIVNYCADHEKQLERLLTNLSLELSDADLRYTEIFASDIPQISDLQTVLENFKTEIYRDKLEIWDLLPTILDVYVLIKKYDDFILLHTKCQPGGEIYLNSQESFNHRITLDAKHS